MAENYKFDYYYGSQADQFSFFRIPKILVRDKKFKHISSDAKILYGLLLDRMSLSIKNKWLDQENRVYIIFTIAEIMQEFECSERKAIEMLAELDNKSGIGLVEKKRQGLGRPNLIYVKNFVVSEEAEAEKNEQLKLVGEVLPFQNCVSLQIRNSENLQDKGCKTDQLKDNIASQDDDFDQKWIHNCKNMHVQNDVDMQDMNCTNLQVKNCGDGQTNYTEYKYTEKSYTEYSDIDSIYPIDLSKKDVMDEIEMCRNTVKKRISYEYLRRNISIKKRGMLEEIIELMVEVLAVERKTMRIAGTDYPYQLVKSRFMHIDEGHIEYVLDCLNQTSSKIGNVKAYILTSLFNATATIDTYYTAAVNHDMADGM